MTFKLYLKTKFTNESTRKFKKKIINHQLNSYELTSECF